MSEMRHLESTVPGLPGRAVGMAGDATVHLGRVDPRRLVGVLWRRGWVVALAFLLAVGAMWLVLGRITPVYQARGSVYVSTGAPGIPEVREIVPVESKELEQLQSVANGMRSSSLLLRVLRAAGMEGDADLRAGSAGDEGVVERFGRRVRVELRRGTRIIDIAVEDRDPERARLLVERIKEEYEVLAAERQERLREMIGRGLAAEEVRLREQMERSSQAMREFREANPVPGIESAQGDEAMGGELAGLRAQLTQVRAERLRLEAEVEGLRNLDVSDPDAVGRLPAGGEIGEVAALARQLREKQAEFARVKERYLFKHPVFREVAGEVARLEQSLTAALVAARDAVAKRYRVSVENESKVEEEVRRAERRAVEIAGLRAQFATLARAADADREVYATVERRLRETSLAGSVPTSVLRWEETPLIPERAVKPRKPVMLALAGGMGLFLGLMVAGLLEWSDRRLRDPDGVKAATGLSLLARIPSCRSAVGGGMVMVSDPASDVAEAFRGLRAVLAAEWPGEGCRSTLFTSARKREGKSFCALNHAASLAMQGYRTLLIDADLRQRGLSRDPVAEDHPMPGLGDYLAGEAQPAETCLLTALPNLYLMASGKPREDAAELLADNRFPVLLEKAFQWFDRVVIDLPCVLGASDVQAVARRDELVRAVGMLRAAGARMAGFVWNQVPTEAGEQPYVSPGRRPIASIEPAGGESLPKVIESAILPSELPQAI